MNPNYLELVRGGGLEKGNNDGSKRREKGDIIGWRTLSTNDPYIFEIYVEWGITIILVDTCTECVLIAHNPWYAFLFVMRFRGIPELLSYLEAHCSDCDRYVLEDPVHGYVAYVHRRDLIDVLVRCMTKTSRYINHREEV